MSIDTDEHSFFDLFVRREEPTREMRSFRGEKRCEAWDERLD